MCIINYWYWGSRINLRSFFSEEEEEGGTLPIFFEFHWKDSALLNLISRYHFYDKQTPYALFLISNQLNMQPGLRRSKD